MLYMPLYAFILASNTIIRGDIGKWVFWKLRKVYVPTLLFKAAGFRSHDQSPFFVEGENIAF